MSWSLHCMGTGQLLCPHAGLGVSITVIMIELPTDRPEVCLTCCICFCCYMQCLCKQGQQHRGASTAHSQSVVAYCNAVVAACATELTAQPNCLRLRVERPLPGVAALRL